ncbi:MAG: hypothetical protein JWO82_2835 [Akkermansiaceae bacterium]|nr:hypothetical protein [Akkermansiaceae bacterium]
MTLPMSTDDIHDVASKDTPSEIEVPKSMYGLIVWAVGRFGPGILIALAAVYGLNKVYTDMQVQNERMVGDMKAQNAAMVEVIRSQTSVNSQVANSLQELSKAVENRAK